ncbi:class I SAM-dependent methyltransferase [Pontibacillus sp. HMF3514]|uniref:class I SAM-dependent DNA methyltransferase n=1 Tax=Pontibacillus sp. HMF3514 TaxID=2692425 RepID=UPI00131FCFA9|nr:class I SAM-dependent methyltransferase [Pontibacillus sp. HMF3514]QHE52708.1 methyltransferase domain-containing protein [Pontibacillus sp. HMF3514]
MEKYAEYDAFAWIYNEYWGRMPKGIEPIIDKLFFTSLPENASVLDLCCGTGQLAQILNERGYEVTGIDGSGEMLKIAQENSPSSTFLEDDARSFAVNKQFDGIISTYDSLNHIMTLNELKVVFRNVYKSLVNGGLFLFDMNMKSTYTGHWNGSFNIVEDDHVCAVRATSQPENRLAQMDITMFMFKDGQWKRSDLTLEQTWYREEELIHALREEGFSGIKTYPSEDFQMQKGRMFYLCKK